MWNMLPGHNSDDATEQYFDLLSKGTLTIPSSQMAEFVLVLLYLIMQINLL